MKKAQARRMQRATLEQLERLQHCSEWQHGEGFVRFSPLFRDYLSKRRVRLNRQYWALKRGQYVKG